MERLPTFDEMFLDVTMGTSVLRRMMVETFLRLEYVCSTGMVVLERG